MAFFDTVKNTITTGIKNTVKGVAEKSFSTPKAPSYTQPKKTAYQNITAQPVETKWYKGAVPTASEMEARAIKVGQQDYQRGEYLYGLFQETQNDPTSPLFNPYTKSTSQAASELSAMGFDVSDPNFIQNNAWLKGEYRLGTSGSPLAPSNSSTAEQNAAYWYNKYMDDEETTLKAEQEWAALQEEVGYWAGRKDRNLTDEEIFSKINWNNYPTLKRMDEAKGKGLSVGLTRPVGYSQDALNGVIYGKRNGVEGDPSRLAVRAAYDGSTGYQRNEEVASRLNPNSDMYNPYAVGSTIDDQALYFGVDSFDKDWVANNRQYMSSMDETERRMYNAVAKAESNTSAAETERAALMAYIDEQIAAGETDPDEIIEKVYGDGWGFDMAENGKTLAKMDESLEPGGTPMAMTRAVPYSRNDVERYIQERCEAENQKKGMDAVVGGLQSFMEKFLTPKELTATEKIAADTKRLVENAVPPTAPEVPEATSEVPAAEDVELGLLSYTRKNPAEIDAPAVKVDEVINPATAMAQMPANPVNPPNPEAMKVTASVVVSHGTEDEKKALIRHVSIDSLKRTNQFVHNFKNEEAGIVLGSMADAFAGENYVQIARAKNAYNGGYAAKLEEEQKRQSELQTQVEYADYAYSPVTGGYNTEVLGLYSGMDEDQKEIVRNSAYNAGSVGWNMEAAAAEFAAAGIADAWAIAENIATVSGYYKSEYATKSFGDIYFGAEEIGKNTSAEIDKMLAPNPFEGVEPLFLEEPDFVANADMEISDLNASIAENKKLAEQDEVYLRDINKEPTIERQYAISEQYGGGASNGLFSNVKDEIDFAFDVLQHEAPGRNEYQTYQEIRTYYEQSGTTNNESYVKQYGEKFLKDYAFAAPAIDQVIADIDSGKIKGVTGEEYQALVDERSRLEREKRSWDYYMLQGNEDFDEVVQRVKDENENYTYDFLKGDTRDAILQGALKGEYYRPNPSFPSDFAYMTQEERDTILYLYGTQGRDAAESYYDMLRDGTYGVIEPRRQIGETKAWEKVAKESPVAASILSVLYSPAKVAGGLYVAGSGIFGYDIDQYEMWLNAGINIGAAREEVKNQITNAFGEGTAGAFVGNLFYDAAMSGGDSLLMAALTPGISLGSAEATNWLTKFGLKAVETSISSAPMALGAAGDVAREVIANGGTQEQALLMAGWAFVAETVSESVTVGNIRDAFNAGPQGAKSFLRQVALDGFEEGTGEMVSEFISTWSDDAIMQELSQRNRLKEQFEAQGMSPEEAQEAADKQIMKNIWYAGLTGALSGGMSTTLSYASGRVGSADAKKTNTGISYGKKDGGDTKNVPINERPWTKEQLAQKEQAETTQTNAQQPSEPVASAPVGGFSIVEGDGAKVAVLESTSGEDVNNQAKTEAVAAALVTSEEQMPSAIASAQEMNSEYGDEATRNFVVDVITKAGMNAQTAGAIVAASLSKGEAHQMLTSMVTGETEVTPETVNQLVETAEADAQNPEIQGEIMGNIQRSVINNAVIDAGNAGGFNSIASQQTAVQTANQKLEEAKSVLQDEKHRYQALGESLNDAVAQFNADPTNQQIEALVTQVAKDMEGQNKMVKQAEQTVTNASQSVQNANKQLELTKATTLDNLRKQETQRIAEETAQAEQAKAEQAAAENLGDSKIHITSYHTEEQKRQIEQYQLSVDENLLAAAKKYKEDKNADIAYYRFSEARPREVGDILELTGIDVTGYTHTATRNFFNHVERRHGENGEHDNSMKNLKDVARVGWIIENYDTVDFVRDENGEIVTTTAYLDSKQKPTQLIQYQKQMDGHVYVVEAVGNNSRKNIWLISAYMKKSPAKQQGNEAKQAPHTENGPRLYARNVIAHPSANIVTDEGTNVNTPKPKSSPQAIAKKMAKELGIGDYIGTRKMNNVPKDVLGYYETRAKYIAVRNKQAGNYAVTMHEAGHAIADKIGMTGTPQMVANLDPVFAASYKPAELPGEAFAEFVAYYMASEQAARNFAGDNFVDAFERALVQNGLDKAVNENAKQLRIWVNADAVDKIGAVIHSRDEGKKSPIKEQFRKLIAGTLDSSSAAEAVASEIRKQSGEKEIPLSEDIRTQALLNNTAHERAFNIISKNLTNANWEVVGDSLSTVLENAGITAQNMQLFERYMLALHSLDRDAQGKPVFDEHITTQERIDFIEKVQRENPEVARAEEAFQKWRTDFLTEFLVKTGRITQEELNNFNAMYPHYVPTQRVKGNLMSRIKERGGSKRYKVRSATGSTEDIWSPIDTFMMMVDSIVADTSANNMALAWDSAAQKYALGEFGRLVTPDVRKLEVDTKPLQAQVEEKLSGEVSDDVLQDVLDTIGEKQSQYISAYNENKPGSLLVYHPDGRISMYEMHDVELYKLLASVNDNTRSLVFEYIGKLVKGMTALTTGSNPLFGFRNFMRDFQNSVNYGSWASNYATGAAKWLRAAWDVFRENGDFQKYQALGGGGWTRIQAGTKKGSSQYRAALFKGYNTSNVGRTAKFVGQKLWNTITFSKLNEVIEQTSRYAEFKYGKNETSTAEGAQKAFVASQDVTVDFHRSGNSNFVKVLKQTIPFFNASAQGVYRTARMLSKTERSRLPQRFAKTVINTGLMSLLANGILLKFLDDDEKKEYALMSDELKAQHIHLPNPNTDVFGLQPLVRIPLAQDPLTYAIHGVVTNAMWSDSSDEPIISGEAIVNTILDSMNPIGSGTIFQPIIGIGKNENWYGAAIVPSNLTGLNDETLQYTEETPDLFVAAGRFFGMSPLKVQYLAEQYTGFFGQIAIPALSKDKNTGELGGLPAVIKAAQKRFTSDPLVSNDVVSSFYDGFETIEGVKQAAEKGKPLNFLRRGLTEEEATAAYTEAKELVSADGILGKTKKEISDLYKEIDEINANPTLSEEKKYVLTSDIRREIIEKTLYAQEAIGAYREKYVTGGNLLTMRFEEGVYAHIPTAYETLPDVFKADESESYMQAAKSVWESTGDDNALPHPLEEFEKKNAEGKKIKYHPKETGHWEEYEKVYHKYYKDYCNTNLKKLASDDEEVRLQVLKDAHSKAHSKAKEWYFDQPGVLE